MHCLIVQTICGRLHIILLYLIGQLSIMQAEAAFSLKDYLRAASFFAKVYWLIASHIVQLMGILSESCIVRRHDKYVYI